MRNSIFFIFALISLIFALGPDGYLWTIFSKLPIFNKFQIPHKFLFYFNFFVIISSCLFIRKKLLQLNVFLKSLTFISVIISTFIHNYYTRESHSNFLHKEDKVLYSPLPKHFTNYLKGKKGRVFPITYHRFADAPAYSYSLLQNFASIYKVPSTDLYDHLVKPTVNLKKNNLREYGVRWLLQYTHKTRDGRVNPDQILKYCTPNTDCFLAYKDSFIELYEISDFLPLAFFKSTPQKSIPNSWDSHGVEVSTDSIQGRLIINTIKRKHLKAYGVLKDGTKEELKLEKDSKQRVQLSINKKFSKVVLNYSPPFLKSFIITLIILVFFSLGYFLISKRIKLITDALPPFPIFHL